MSRKKNKESLRALITKFITTTVINNAYAWAFISFLLTIYTTIAVSTFNPHDPSWFYQSTKHPSVTNHAGVWGAHGAALAFYCIGNAAYIIPLLFAYTTYTSWRKKTVRDEWDRIIAFMTYIPVVAALMYSYQLGAAPFMTSGGIVGFVLYQKLAHVLGSFITSFMLSMFLLMQLLIITRLSFITFATWIIKGYLLIARLLRLIVIPCITYSARILQYLVRKTIDTVANFSTPADNTTTEHDFIAFEHPQQYVTQTVQQVEQQEQIPTPVAQPRPQQSIKTNNVFTLPPMTMFNKTEKNATNTVNHDHKQLVAVLQEKLARFGVTGSVTGIKPGPVVTLFEYQPDIDTKLSKIVALENDLALALEAMSVRIIAPIPGTSRVGFEVANKERKSVLMGDMVRSSAFTRSTYRLPIVLGSDTVGESVIIDLTDTPHLLVAGSTGSGKSVALNTLLLSILTKRAPEEVKLVIIDPKRLEFASYQDIPHLLFPIITHPSKAAPVLKWLVKNMEERYERMAQVGVRAISEYHRLCNDQQQPNDLPYIIVMIDELADLMMVAGKEVEESIARLAQMARAAGIHLVVATQRPSVDVITGVIKVNFPSRISFRVTSKIDSRTILDTGGAEHLLGKGDMLFMDAQSARMRRIHGAYVTDKEIHTIVAHIKSQQAPSYVDLQDAIATYNQTAQEQEEPLLKDIMLFLDAIDEVSISLLQRRFKIGYNRSARIIELLEQQGKIMPADGGKTRKIVR